jgi:hypothetical protein
MTRLPWIKLYFDDLDVDCGSLSLRARGAWVWIIGYLHHHGGEKTLPLDGWARVVRASIGETIIVIGEIIDARVCDSSVTRDALSQKSDAQITLKCRRIYREYKQRETHALRQRRYRQRRECDAVCDATVTKEISDAKKLRERESQRETIKSAPKRRGTLSHFCPEDFTLSDQDLRWARQTRPDVDIPFETQKFRDYEFSKPRSDWGKVWRNWIRNATARAISNRPQAQTQYTQYQPGYQPEDS